MPDYIKTYPHLASVMLHLIVIFSIVFYVDFSSKKITLGQDSPQTVNSYIYQNNVYENKFATTNPNHSALRKPLQHKVADSGIQKSIPSKKIAQSALTRESLAASLSQQQSLPSHGHQASELISLLHAAIQKQQHYPASALRLEREGKVKVKFTMDKNGIISNLQIAESSGTSSLDEAALSAVKDVAPFSEASQYLHDSQTYSIDVAFELT